MRIAPFVLAVLVSTSAHAAVWGDDPADASADDKVSMAICQKTKAVGLPKAPAGDAGACDPAALYYGIGRPADPEAARACALRQVAGGKEDDPLQAAGMLATIYANGKGTPRDLDLAIAYACRIAGAPAEMDARIAHLVKLKKDGPGAEPFDVCTDATSGFLFGACASRDASIADAKRATAFAAIDKGLEAPGKAAFARLLRQEKAYATSVGEKETDAGGTIGPSQVVGAEQAQDEAFAATLASVMAGKLSAEAAEGFQDADRLLNATYGKIMGLKDASALGSVDKGGIKATQRAWLIYRDAFVAFAKLAAPSVPGDAIKTDLTIQRTKALSAFLG